ncbi:MAG: 16S rRNA (adenine(1518)-N(6)/adenine(1519)-N(6))-dimethyltransferase RsmA [Desulfobacterales bacterium]
MTSPKTLLKAWNLRPSKSLGQHFLTDPRTAEAIVRHTRISPDDTILEIGAGLGALTVPLARAGKQVYAVEKDPDIAGLLQTETLLNRLTNIHILTENILSIDIPKMFKNQPGGIVVAGNLPYNISSQILIRLVASRSVLSRAVVMLQDELAERVIEPPGSRSYGRISVMLQYCAVVKKVLQVSSDRFYPKPAIDSAVLLIEFKQEPDFPADDEAFFFRVIKAAFGQRRKTLKNALAGSELHLSPAAASSALTRSGIDPGRRAESLSIQEFVRLSNTIGEICFLLPEKNQK